MKSGNYLAPIYRLSQIDSATVPRKISFSQWTMFEQCPHRWKLTYIDKLDSFTASIETVFGTAFHETFQHFLTTMYTDSVKRAESIDFRGVLTEKMRVEYLRCVAESGGTHFSNPVQMAEYLEDGVAILEWFKKRRSQYFSTKNYELVGIEIELCVPASDKNDSVYWYGFIDVGIRHIPTNKITLFDIKTSRNGWKATAKSDPNKTNQLVAYKTYFSKQFGVPVDNIDVEFFIVKRKIIEESMFPQKRIQNFKPASGTPTRKKVQRAIDQFIETCFLPDGEKREDRNYVAVAGRGAVNCKYCPWKTDYERCPKENRVKDA